MEKEDYESPKLTKVGKVKDLTLGGPADFTDDFSGGCYDGVK